MPSTTRSTFPGWSTSSSPAPPTPFMGAACEAANPSAHLFWHYAGNRLLSLITGMLFNTTLSDMEVGYKAIRGDIARSLTLVSEDFCIEPEITARILSIADLRIYEVPIAYYGRTFAEGKKITWRDGLRAAHALWRFRIATWRETA